eukprot:scaffold13524_cov109-Isochrysis_galbana.AAC.7
MPGAHTALSVRLFLKSAGPRHGVHLLRLRCSSLTDAWPRCSARRNEPELSPPSPPPPGHRPALLAAHHRHMPSFAAACSFCSAWLYASCTASSSLRTASSPATLSNWFFSSVLPPACSSFSSAIWRSFFSAAHTFFCSLSAPSVAAAGSALLAVPATEAGTEPATGPATAGAAASASFFFLAASRLALFLAALRALAPSSGSAPSTGPVRIAALPAPSTAAARAARLVPPPAAAAPAPPRAPGGTYFLGAAGPTAVADETEARKYSSEGGAKLAGSAGRHAAMESCSTFRWCSSAPDGDHSLNPLSTRRRGHRMAVRKARESGAHSCATVMCASTVARHRSVFRSQKDNSPPRLPKPARMKERPCGAHRQVLRAASPKSWTRVLFLSAEKSAARGGEKPKSAQYSVESGDHCTSWIGPSLGKRTMADSPRPFMKNRPEAPSYDLPPVSTSTCVRTSSACPSGENLSCASDALKKVFEARNRPSPKSGYLCVGGGQAGSRSRWHKMAFLEGRAC